MQLEKLPQQIVNDEEVLLRPIEEHQKTTEKTTESGIYLGEKKPSQSSLQKAEVIMVGSDVKCKVGDIVIYNRTAGKELLVEEQEYLLMRELNNVYFIY